MGIFYNMDFIHIALNEILPFNQDFFVRLKLLDSIFVKNHCMDWRIQ